MQVARTLVVSEAMERGFNDQKTPEVCVPRSGVILRSDSTQNGRHSKTNTPHQAPMTSAGGHVDAASSLLQGDRKVVIDEGQKPIARHPTSGRQRSVSIASSIGSNISPRSGVSDSNRLLRCATQGIEFRSRSVVGNHNGTCQTPAQSQDKDPRVTVNCPTQPPEAVFQKPPRMDGTTLSATSTVTCPEITVTQGLTKGAVPNARGKANASTPLRQMLEPVKNTGSDGKRLMFSFKHPQLSIANNDEDQKAPRRTQEVASPRNVQLDAGAVLLPPTFERGGGT